MRMNRLLLVFVAILWLVVTSTMAGPDNIVFLSSYKNHVRYARVDRPDNKTVREIYISPASAKVVKTGEPLQHGTVITMEVYRTHADEEGEPAKDAEGRFIKGDLTGIFVMEKQAGWGADYTDDLRNGEWEYARFTPEGQHHPNADTLRVSNATSRSVARISCLRSHSPSRRPNDGPLLPFARFFVREGSHGRPGYAARLPMPACPGRWEHKCRYASHDSPGNAWRY
jgi:Cytochrome P460